MSADKQTMQALRVLAKAANADALAPQCIAQDPPAIKAGEALVRVRSAGVNPSDVKAALGLMPQAVFPRTPGRDYAGVVVEGPNDWVGKEIWGSGGDVGITRDGSHAGWLVLPEAALRAKPKRLKGAKALATDADRRVDESGERGGRFRMQQNVFAGSHRSDEVLQMPLPGCCDQR